MPDRISEHVIAVGVATIAALAIAGTVTYTRVQMLSDASGYVSRSERVRYALQRTLSTVQDAESAVRGYLITHEEPFLEPYVRARPELDSNLQSLTQLLSDSPTQVTRFRDLDRLARARLDRLNTVVGQIRDGTFVMPPAPRASSEAKKLMDSFRAQIAVMQSYEDARLAERLRTSANAREAGAHLDREHVRNRRRARAAPHHGEPPGRRQDPGQRALARYNIEEHWRWSHCHGCRRRHPLPQSGGRRVDRLVPGRSTRPLG